MPFSLFFLGTAASPEADGAKAFNNVFPALGSDEFVGAGLTSLKHDFFHIVDRNRINAFHHLALQFDDHHKLSFGKAGLWFRRQYYPDGPPAGRRV